MASKASSDFIVRPATPADAGVVNQLLSHSYSELLTKDYDPNFLDTALPLICTAREDLLTCGTWYVCEGILDRHGDTKSGLSILGCGGWTPRSPMAGRPTQDEFNVSIPNLRHFATHPQATRRGVAKAIWKKSLADMSESQRVGPMEVISTITAVSFYESLGFVTVRDLELPLDGGNCKFPCTLMRREELPQPT